MKTSNQQCICWGFGSPYILKLQIEISLNGFGPNLQLRNRLQAARSWRMLSRMLASSRIPLVREFCPRNEDLLEIIV